MKLLVGIVLNCLLATTFGPSASAQEAVIYWRKPRPATESVMFTAPVETIRGTIADIDTKAITCVIEPQKPPTKIPVDQVVGVQITWQKEELAQANAQYRKSEFADSIRRYQAALKNPALKLALWEQKLMAMQIVPAAEQIGRYDIAGKVFWGVHSAGIPIFAYSCIPLPWTNDLVPPEVIQDLEKEFGPKSDMLSQLILGSWRLATSARADGISQLETVAASKEEPLNRLARVQLWRTVPPQKFVSENLADALHFRDQLPISLQLGPTAIIADHYERAGNAEYAYQYWVEVALASKKSRLPIFQMATRRLEALATREKRTDEWNQLKEVLKSE